MKSTKNNLKPVRKLSGFTLVELIVVITILVILGTIAFVSLSGYSGSARDGSRVSDLTLVSKALDIVRVKSGILPAPTNGSGITYSGGIAWTQGSVGDSVFRALTSLSKKPLDPQYAAEYTYSVLANGKEYELAGVTENTVASVLVPSFLIAPVFAADSLVAYVKGTYNSQLAKASSGSNCSAIALPSIVLGNIPTSNRLEDAGSGALVFKGKGNLPFSYQGKTSNGTFTGSVVFRDYGTDTSVIVSTTCSVPATLSDALALAVWLRDAYSGTVLANDPKYTPITQATNTTELTRLGASIANTALGSSITVSSGSTIPSFTCATQPNIANATGYTVGSPMTLNQWWVYSASPGSCTFSCLGGYAYNGGTNTCNQTSFAFNQTISVNTPNYDLKAAAIAAGWNQVLPLIATVTINTGISVYPFTTGTGFPTGSTLALVNNGYVSGGTPSGTALTATAPISITNNGTIRWAGGNGGGGHPYTGGYVYTSWIGLGAHGITVATAGKFWDGGGGNTITTGAGGTWGTAGAQGTTTQPASGWPNHEQGSAAGACTSGNANITWVVVGTRIGAVN